MPRGPADDPHPPLVASCGTCRGSRGDNCRAGPRSFLMSVYANAADGSNIFLESAAVKQGMFDRRHGAKNRHPVRPLK